MLEKQIKELNEVEVNMYQNDCGDAQLHCITDCIIIHTSLINPDR